jgi:hypothetical protein
MMKHKPVLFHAKDEKGNPVYHTNVLLCISDRFAITCLGSVKDEHERKLLSNSLVESGNELIEISLKQMHQFAANALALQNKKGEQVLVISAQGWNALDSRQQNQIRSFCPQIITPALNIIETCGGGSARCMLAELFNHTFRPIICINLPSIL